MADLTESDGPVFVQITARRGEVRGPVESYSAPDLIELNLEPNQRVIQIEWSRGFESRRRKTVDWRWTAWIESRFPKEQS